MPFAARPRPVPRPLTIRATGLSTLPSPARSPTPRRPEALPKAYDAEWKRARKRSSGQRRGQGVRGIQLDDQVDRLRLVILVGAAREDRFGLATAEWLGARARLRQDFEVDVIDLATAWLPDLMAADPTAPLPSGVRDLCPWLAGADDFAVVTQEYRFGCYGGARARFGGSYGSLRRARLSARAHQASRSSMAMASCRQSSVSRSCVPGPRPSHRAARLLTGPRANHRERPAKGGPARDAGHPLASRPLRVR
ncbi:NADPH-dependent FMN reductase [Streptomyces sp. NPDC090231]|uniref:NADPH-dependent FMN reductase n=1 Tax=unclassified Streptomyces TaxID=2593676 RepID=UPI0037FE8D8C